MECMTLCINHGKILLLLYNKRQSTKNLTSVYVGNKEGNYFLKWKHRRIVLLVLQIGARIQDYKQSFSTSFRLLFYSLVDIKR